MKLGRIIAAVLVLGAAGGGAYYYVSHKAPAAEATAGRGRGGRRGGPGADPIPVLVVPATTKDVPVYLDALGTVQAFNTVNVKAQVDGTLVEVRFQEGQDVKAGDVLARIDPRVYQAAYDQAAAKKAQDEATMANARLDLVRYQKLAATAYTSAQTSDTQKALVAQTEALLRQDQAQMDSAKTNLSYTTITSPLDGRTGIRQVDQGNIVHAADTTPLTVITQLKPISVVFTLPQQTLPAVAAAMHDAVPEVLALPQTIGTASSDAAGAALPSAPPLDRGKLAVLDNTVDQATGTIKLKATFPNPGLLLWPGGFINVRLLVDTERGVTVVPPVAVQRGPQGTYVYVLKDDNTATRRDVKVGHEDQVASVITEGLQPGEQVVTDGASRVTDGAKVQVQTPGAPAAIEPVRPNRTPGQRRRTTASQ